MGESEAGLPKDSGGSEASTSAEPPDELGGRKSCKCCGAENPGVAQFCRQCGQSWALCAVAPPALVVPGWRRLKLRMTRKEVRKLLGEPLQVEISPTDAPGSERWSYEYTYTNAGAEMAGQSASVARWRGTACFHLQDGGLTTWAEPVATET